MVVAGTLGTFTPYTTVTPLVGGDTPSWVAPRDEQRIASYQKYEELYWSNPTAFRLVLRGDEENPIYVPNPKSIVDSTAHFLMKGFELKLPSEGDQKKLDTFLKREKFYTTFHTAKHSGVVRGDYVFHIIADPSKPAEKRVSLISVDPASYFPITNPDDPDDIIGADIVDQLLQDDGTTRVIRQRYTVIYGNGRRRITSQLEVLNPLNWWDEKQVRVEQTLIAKKLLPERITAIPIYHFQNIDWQGQPFGSSELRGFERILASINQSATDEDTALALEGLGVYATDAPHPTDVNNNPVDWEIAPGYVAEIPSGTKFERVSGVGSVKPFQDHLKYLDDHLFDASGTFRPGAIDAQVAQSGIALAIRFLPTLAKVEHREEVATSLLQQMFFDWSNWEAEYENNSFSSGNVEVEIALPDKLPKNKVDRLNELNNMVDRKVISKAYYRRVMEEEFGYQFPADIEKEILDEQKAILELQQQFTPVQPNGSGGPSDQSGTKNRQGPGAPQRSNRNNNRNRSNESAGSEAR